MNNINGVPPAWAPRPVEPTTPAAVNPAADGAKDISDVVEVSTAAALAAKVREIPDVRADLVARVRQEIEAGTYETPERIDAAVDRLMEELLADSL